MSSKHGRIIAEYDEYSIWETPPTEPVEVAIRNADGVAYSYKVSYSHQIIVSTYEQALLEPEDLVFQ